MNPPFGGATNKALQVFVAKKVRVAKSRSKIAAGEKSSNKRLENEGVTVQAVRDALV